MYRRYAPSRRCSTVLFHLAAALGVLGLLFLGVASNEAQAQTPVTSIVNGAGETTLELNHNGSLLVPGTRITDGTETDSIPAEGAGTRLMWYPAKAAFRAGQVGDQKDGTQWDASEIGSHSVAFGRDTKASGPGATAMGDETTASSSDATAMGFNTTASGPSAMAIGSFTTASASNTTAIGNKYDRQRRQRHSYRQQHDRRDY